MKKKIVLLGLIGIIFFSCTTFQMTGTSLALDQQDYTALGSFERKVWVNEFLGSPGGMNLFNLSSEAMDNPIDKAIREEIKKLDGNGAVDIEITYKGSVSNILLTIITFGIYSPATAEIKGEVVNFKI